MNIELIQSENSLETLEECISHANRVILDCNCENTKRATNGDLNYWRAWGAANKLDFDLVFRKEHLVAFIIQHSEGMPSHVDGELIGKGFKRKPGTHKIATIERRIASLSTFLNLNQIPNCCYDPDILFLMKKLRNKHGLSAAWGKAITVDVLNDLLETCKESLLDIRDKALLLFGFSTGGRRRSEIANASIEYIQKHSDGNFTYNLKKSKTNREGHNEIKPIFGRAAMALSHWLNESKIDCGAIFRSISSRGKIGEKALCDKHISTIVKKRCGLAGYDPNEYTAHSLRSGFVTEGGKRGKPIGDIMELTGHRNVQQLMHYYKCGNVANNSTAYLAG